MGFTNVYDYPAGKIDWIGAGLPLEARPGQPEFVIDFIHGDAPTCSLSEQLRKVTSRATGIDQVAVVNDANVVLGIVSKDSCQDADNTVENIMNPAPTTFRPTVAIGEAAAFMNRNDASEILITTSEGKLVGFLDRRTAEHAVHELRSEQASSAPT